MLRRCEEDREFTKADNPSLWPMYVHKGGSPYGFCPAKAGWDHRTVDLYRKLVLSSETGVMLVAGGSEDQPEWFMEHFSWFAPRYREMKITSIIEKILPSFTGRGAKPSGDNTRTTPRKRGSPNG